MPEYLAEDFSAENVRTQRAVKALYQSLEKHATSPSLEAIFDQWAQFFGAVTDYENWRVKLANETELRKMVKPYGIAADKLDLNRFFFATHTFFAILTKLLAYIVVGRYTDLPTPPLKEWKNLTNEQLAENFIALEKGGPFRASGIRNFLEGDFFAWYAKYFTPELACVPWLNGTQARSGVVFSIPRKEIAFGKIADARRTAFDNLASFVEISFGVLLSVWHPAT